MNEYGRSEQLDKQGLTRILHPGVQDGYPLMFAHFARLPSTHFAPDLKLCREAAVEGGGGLTMTTVGSNAED